MFFFELLRQNEKELEKSNVDDEYTRYCRAVLETLDYLSSADILDVNEKDEEGETILMYVVDTENLDWVKFLVESGADVNTIDKGYDYALLKAAQSCWQEGFDYLASFTSLELREEAESRLPEYQLYHQRLQNYAVEAFVDAAFEGDIYTIRKAISQDIDINAISSNGETALHKAIRMNHVSIVRLLLEAGADPNLKEEDSTERSPLMIALFWRTDDAIFKALIDAGADINCSAFQGMTVLIQEVLKRNLKVVQQLLELGVDLKAKAIDGNTALTIATELYKQNQEVDRAIVSDEAEKVVPVSIESQELLDIIHLLESYGATES